MFSTAEKTTKPAIAVQQKAAGTSFFKKAGEESFFGAKENPVFFNAPVQAKLTVSSPDDPQEKEADTVAEKVMRLEEPIAAASLPDKKEENLQRQEEKKEEVQVKAEPGLAEKISTQADSAEKLSTKLSRTSLWLAPKAAQYQEPLRNKIDTNIHINRKNETVFPAEITLHSGRGSPPNRSSSFEQTLAASKGGGSALPKSTRQFMESRFDTDFSGVRIHTGPAAEQLSSSILAQAFAHGNDIYFNQNKYSPDSSSGRTLLAHELTHTIQQDTSPVKNKAAPKKLSQLPLELNTTVAQVARADAIDLNKKEYTAISRALAAPNTSAATSGNIDLSGKSGGSTMPGEVKEFLQDHFQTSVDDIRIHLDDDAAGICRMLRVPAFTQGRHICFDPSRYAPETEEGGLLLAKQVAESFKQRSIKVAGGVGSLNAAAQEAKKEGQSSPAAAKPAQPETGLPKSKNKKKKAAREGKDTKGKKGGKGAKEKKGKVDADTGKAVKANPKKSPASPDEDPAFQKVVKKAKAKAKDQQQHEPADAKAAHAQKAATAVPNEAQSKAQKRKTEAMEEVAKEDKPFDAASFKADLLKKIEAITPKNLEEATEFKENNRIGEVKGAMGQKVASEKEKSAGPVEQVTEQPLAVNEGDNKKPEPLPPSVKGAPPGSIGAREAAPKKKLDNEISMAEQSQSLDEEMKTNNITEEQLAKSNEPSFIAGLQEKKAAQKDAKEKPLLYRKQENQIQQEAQIASEGEASRSMGAMFATRGKNFEGVVKQQQTAKTKDEAERAAVVQKIEGMYKNTETVVNALLTVAETTANTIFDTGSEKARQDFETYVDGEMRAYKRKRYSGFWGGLRWAKDKLVGMPDAVNKFYIVGRERYLAQMNTVITQVANVVTTNLNAAKQAIKNGKKEIADYVNGLEGSLQNVGKEAAESIQDKFDALEQTVNDKRNQLIDGLAQKYVANLKKLDDRITELKEANKGLVQKAIGMLKEIWKVIKNLYQLFQTILSRIASIIGLIINDPGAFFSNLGKAFKQGFDRFQSRIGEHLENGLMIWLSTQLGVSNLKLPPKFDIGAIFNLVLQVLGVSFATIKERAIILFGAKKVEMMEKGVEIFQRIQKDGLGAVWDMLEEKLSDFKDIVWEAIKNFIRDSVVRAAITFVLSLLNPVAAFVKACMAIYDFVMMLVRMKDRILDLLNAILDAVALIASGSVDKAAAAVENAFAKSIPIIIGFLAALLHLNDIGAKVRGIITRIRDRIFKVIDWVLQKIYNGAKVVIDKLVGAGKSAVGAVMGWLGIRKEFRAKDGLDHSIYFEGSGTSAKLFLASRNPGIAESRIETAKSITNDPAEKAKYEQALTKAAQIRQAINALPGASAGGVESSAQTQLATHMESLKEILKDCKIDGAETELTAVTYRTHSAGMAQEVKAEPLTKYPGNTVGSGTVRGVAGGPLGWNAATHYNSNVKNHTWKQVHLLSHQLHGPGRSGASWNLTPTIEVANANLRTHETVAIGNINATPPINYKMYKTTVTYGHGSNPQNHPVLGNWDPMYFPSSISVTFQKDTDASPRTELIADNLPTLDPNMLPISVDYLTPRKLLMFRYFTNTPVGSRDTWGRYQNQLSITKGRIPNDTERAQIHAYCRNYFENNFNKPTPDPI